MKMNKKYIIRLAIIGIMLLTVTGISTGYGVWVSTKNNDSKNSIVLNCFRVYFSNSDTVRMSNIKPLLNSDGEETSPETITVTNICKEEKELQIRLNILEETNVDTKALTIKTTGNIQRNTMLYKNLENTKTQETNIKQSKLIGKITVKANETIRTNVKLWFDEKKLPTIEKDKKLVARYEILDSADAIKDPLSELILSGEKDIDKKQISSFDSTSYTSEGLYPINAREGKAYYYRGMVTNNYVQFANEMWRIVAINPDSTIRLVLNYASAHGNFSERTDSMDYTGLSYKFEGEESNDILTYLNGWYKTRIEDRGFDKYIASSGFCNDSTTDKKGYNKYNYGAYERIVDNKQPTIICPTSSNNFGGEYNMKIGLLSVDEVAIAGGVYNINNNGYYLYNGDAFYTMSGAEFINNTAYIFSVSSSGSITTSELNSGLGIRPVINIDSSITASGTGTIDDPYVLDLE